ncbi:PA domain-containing protein [Trichoderma gamsii]|uniref:PA domain-containing protein n=1 Tax=Trichoderma gamsii TaxID=398673 RepID=A0A2P4ZGA4_9HYPO|nr:PA domain-containing protein [Trichoderma gamsii]PON23319.1 PA domain-containing protein [Trichoderma gamsii]
MAKSDISSHFKLRPRGATTLKWPILLGSLAVYILFWKCCKFSAFNLQQTLLSVPSAEHVRNWSAYYTSEAHFVGQGLSQAQWTEARWKEFGITDTRIASYNTLVPVPTGHQRLALLRGDEVLYEAPLVDDFTTKGPAGNSSFLPAYLGFSTNGNISASYVFCNFGSAEDFQDLKRANVDAKGKIGIVKLANASPYLGLRNLLVFRGEQLVNAGRAGLIAVVFYTDPQNDGPITEANGYKTFPAGPARPPAAIERGTVATGNHFRDSKSPKVPCIPISYADAIHLLGALNGHGPSAEELGPRWHGGGLEFYGVHYNVGPSPAGILLHLINEADVVETPVHNVIGTIPGVISDEVVILGSHRDSWGHGAGDPGSGSAALNEVVRSFGVALRHGWRPLRTIVFASFEGEEIGQVGSSNWITDHSKWLKASAVAYLNVVVAAAGSSFKAKASPLLYRAVLTATDTVPSPNQTVAGQSVRDVWGGSIGTPGGGDAISFQGISCVSAVDFSFSQGIGDGAFPYHTGFDSFEWMDQVGDPGWKYHITSAKIWSIMAAYLTESAVLKTSVADYASALQKWMDELCSSNLCSPEVDLAVMISAVKRLAQAAKRFDSYAESLSASRNTWWRLWSGNKLNAAIRGANKVYIAFERQFFHERGADTFPSFHHVLYGPAAWHAEQPPLAALHDNLRKKNWEDAMEWRDAMAEKIDDAARLLEDHLDEVNQKDNAWTL